MLQSQTNQNSGQKLTSQNSDENPYTGLRGLQKKDSLVSTSSDGRMQKSNSKAEVKEEYTETKPQKQENGIHFTSFSKVAKPQAKNLSESLNFKPFHKSPLLNTKQFIPEKDAVQSLCSMT